MEKSSQGQVAAWGMATKASIGMATMQAETEISVIDKKRSRSILTMAFQPA